MLNLEKIGNKITKRRKELKMTQNTLADKLYVTHQAVSKWENGKSIPSIEILYDLTTILDVSIDYLLKDVEIENNDYETILNQTSREAAIHKFLNSDNQKSEIEHLFYLLQSEERQLIIEKMINHHLDLEPKDVWHLLSKKERFYLIGVITSNKYDYDLDRIRTQLSVSEKAIIRNQIVNGSYKYYLNYKGVIR